MKFRIFAMLLTGFALAMALLWAMQFTKRAVAEPSLMVESDQSAEKPIAIRPPSFTAVTEMQGSLRLSGLSEPQATVVLSQGGTRLGEASVSADGSWVSALPIDPRETQAITLIMLLEDGTRVRSDETLFRIPQVEEEFTLQSSAEDTAIVIPSAPFEVPTLILLTTPGGPL